MTNLIEQNKKLFGVYWRLARFIGWGLIILGTIGLSFKFAALTSRISDGKEFMLFLEHEIPWNLVSFLPTGVVALGIGQFLRYLSDKEYTPGWLLRHFASFIRLYAIFLAGSFVLYFIILCFRTTDVSRMDIIIEYVIIVSSAIFFAGGKVLILFGIALFIKNVLPVIEESRTLV